LNRLFGLELPVIQAPMAGAQGSALAIAVSNAGGLGSLPCAMLTPDAMRAELKALTAATSNPYNVNFFCHQQPEPDPARESEWRKLLAPYYAELGIDPESTVAAPARVPFNGDAMDVLEEFRPPVISFHFGLPSKELLGRAKQWGAKILSSATTLDEARYLEANGADAVIAQGFEAGGHRGLFLSNDINTQTGTLALTWQITKVVSIPVIAAGGIADALGVTAARVLGAAAAQIGTAYLLCPEATTSPVHRAALKADDARFTALTNLFTGRPARGIVNRLMREIGPLSGVVPPFPLAATAIAPLRAQAEREGRGDFSPLWAGQNVLACREVSAAALTRELAGADR
jgi:nitronate monooxygenase